MSSGWSDPFIAPKDTTPLAYRGEKIYGKYPEANGYGTPPGWSLSEWIVEWEDTPFAEQYRDHVEDGMEMTVVLSDYHAMRGTGKTTLSIKLARAMDRTDEGLTADKVTNSAEEFIDAYVDQPQGSGLVFDEAEAGINSRDAMTNVNKEMNEKVSMGRVGEKYAVWNMPDIGQIDKEIKKLAHYWVLVQRRGRARVYKLSNNPFEDQTYTKPICNLTWGALPDSDEAYRALDEHKWDKLHGDGENYIPRDEHEEELEKERKQAEKDARNEFIRAAYRRDLLTQPELANITDLSQGQVSRIIQNGGGVEA